MAEEYKNKFFGLLLSGVVCVLAFLGQKIALMTMLRFDTAVFDGVIIGLPLTYALYLLLYHMLCRLVVSESMSIGLSVALSAYAGAVLMPALLSEANAREISSPLWIAVYVYVSWIIAMVYRGRDEVLYPHQKILINSLMIFTIIACMVFDWFADRDIYTTHLPGVGPVVAVLVCGVLLMFAGAGSPYLQTQLQSAFTKFVRGVFYILPAKIGDIFFPYTSSEDRFETVGYPWGLFFGLVMAGVTLAAD